MKRLLVALAITAILPVANASADTIIISQTLGPGTYGFSASYDNGSATENYGYFAGQLMLHDQTTNKDYIAYCLDFFSYLKWTEEMALLDIAAYPGGGASPAPPHAQPGIGPKLGWILNQTRPSDVGLNDFAGAIQLALWEVAYEDPNIAYSLATGWFKATPNSIVTSETTRLFGLMNANSSGPGTWFNGTGGPEGSGLNQDFGSADPIPEPASVILFGTGLIGLARALRRKATK
ncbi:MAG: PEP-CTERM sorting domain-containing protein [Acidobacteria bacterium]|nr:PEP-CTERM sorting domain-containing protein [Acidobacteriota bacterium]